MRVDYAMTTTATNHEQAARWRARAAELDELAQELELGGDTFGRISAEAGAAEWRTVADELEYGRPS